MASRSATSMNARYVPTSRTVVKPALRVARAFRTPVIASSAADVVDRRDAGVLEVADQVAVAIDEARDDPVAGERDRLGIGGRRVARAQHGLDPLVDHEQAPVGEPRPGDDVEQVWQRRSGDGRRPWPERSRATMRS